MALEPPSPSPSLVSDSTTDFDSLHSTHLDQHCDSPEDHSCGICSKTYTNPRLLPCLHSFCLECIKNQSQESADNKLSMECPKCKRAMNIPDNNPALLHNDLHLTDSIHVLELLHKVTSTPAPHCDWCEDDGVSVAYCYDCCNFLCSECYSFHCRMTRRYKGHAVLLLESLRELNRAEAVSELEKNIPMLSKCVDHDGEELKFHCNQCFKPVCERCIATQHQEHKYCNTSEDSIGKTKDNVCNKVAGFASSHEKVANSITRIKKVKNDVTSNEESITSKLDTVFTEAYKQLEIRHKQLIKETKSIANNKREKLTNQQTTLEVVTRSSDHCKAFATRACDTYNSTQFLSVAKPISDRATALLEELKTAPIEICETADISLVLDTDALTRGIDSFGSVTDIAPCPSQCSSIIPCRVLARDTKMEIQVISKNQQGHRIAKGDSVVKGLLHSYDNSAAMEFNGEDQGNGLYNLSISSSNTGNYMLTLTINGHEIRLSPFPFSIRIVPVHEYRTFAAPLQVITSVNQPRGITFTSNGTMYISSEADKCIYIFDSNGAPKQTIIKPSLALPSGIDAYNDEMLYITDTAGHVIQPILIGGEQIAMNAICSEGDNLNELRSPTNVRISPDNKLYISDTGNARIQVLDRNTHDLIYPLNNFGSDDFIPHGIAFDLKGNVHVAGGDQSTMICVFTPDGSFIRQYDCGIPASDIAIDWSGYSLCVGKDSFVVISPNGELVHRVDTFNCLNGVGVSPNGSIWITDTKANKVIKLAMNFFNIN